VSNPRTRTGPRGPDDKSQDESGCPAPRFWKAGLLSLPFSCSPPRYPPVSKPLKVMLDIRYQYAIMASLSRHCRSVPPEPCSPATRSFPLPQYLCASSFHVLASRSRTKVLKFRSLFSSGYALFQVPYPVSPVFATIPCQAQLIEEFDLVGKNPLPTIITT